MEAPAKTVRAPAKGKAVAVGGAGAAAVEDD